MTARAELAAAITPLLPENVRVIDHPKDLDALEGTVRAVVMITRTGIKPNGPSYLMDFEVVVIEPKSDQDGYSEDSLDEITDELIEALDADNTLTWTQATRSTYADTLPAYKFDITQIATKE